MEKTEQQKSKEAFRKFLRTKCSKSGDMLKNLMSAADIYLPQNIRTFVRSDFESLYGVSCTLDDLIAGTVIMHNDDSILAMRQGYICVELIDLFLNFYAETHDISQEHIESLKSRYQAQLAEKRSETEIKRVEGRIKESSFLLRSRNRRARQECLDASGYKCYVCGFDFEKTYGDLGKGFLEVHHKKPLSSYDEEHEVSPADLCALCSNCHSMVHRQKNPVDVDYLKLLLSDKKFFKQIE